MKRRDFAIAGTSLTSAVLFACSDDDGGDMMGTGGNTSTGGAGTGGSATGGSTASGGSATGGSTASGGSSTGGSMSSGGSASGGTSSGGSESGGSSSGGSASGGESSTGGAGSGGEASTGGVSGSGGASTGGESGTGGSMGVSCASIGVEADKHMHMIAIPIADVEAAEEKTYMATGSGHMHMVTVTADDFAALANDGMVEVYQPNDGAHDHTYTLTCEE